MWTPKRDKSQIRTYSGEFQDLPLDGLRFELPESFMTAFRNRNLNNGEFYAHRIKDGEFKYISLYDTEHIRRNRAKRLKELGAYVIVPDNFGFVSLHPDFIEYLNLVDKITIEDECDEVIRLWNPEDFRSYSPNDGVEFRGDLDDFQRRSYDYLRGKP